MAIAPALSPDFGPMQEELFQIIKRLSIKRGDFVLASGQRSNYYVDCRLSTLDGRGAYLMGHLLHELLAPLHVDAVGGMTLGADPIVSSVIYRSAEVGNPMAGFIVRKAAKGHGAGNQIEGHLAPWMRIALVEDVVTTGGSTLKAIEAIRKAHPTVEIAQIFSIIDRNAGGKEAFSRLGIPFQSLYNVQAFLEE
ncbi:orotate phosphoribosyltransferase [Vampirovibrio sp.]|uniref:orotate phosphoribosyltransferase n=1 Tax=Vampirovibrio sp. TaxID=2717857 RepID=UPI00359408E2